MNKEVKLYHCEDCKTVYSRPFTVCAAVTERGLCGGDVVLLATIRVEDPS